MKQKQLEAPQLVSESTDYITWDDTSKVCPEAGEYYIHQSPNKGAHEMTAGKGPCIHTYKSKALNKGIIDLAKNIIPGKCANIEQIRNAPGPEWTWQIKASDRCQK